MRWASIVALWLGLGAPLGAQAPQDAALSWHFLVAASYQFNFDQPASGASGLRVFDTQHRQWRFNLARASLTKPAAPVGFQLDVVSGADVPVMASLGAWDPTVADLTQAYVTWRLGLGGTELRAGKFVTSAGYEVIPAWDNLNPTQSRSFLFGYAIPFTHTGVRAVVPIGSAVSVLAGVNKGWDKWSDNNGGPSVELSVTVTPRPWLAITLDTHHGPEQTGNVRYQRRLYDLVATVTPNPAWQFGVNGDYAAEANASLTSPGEPAEWYGWAAYARHRFAPQWAAGLRVEQFTDRDGARTGTPQTLADANLTLDWSAQPNILVRLDGRLDGSTARVFERTAGLPLARRQGTVALSFVFTR